MNGLHGVGYGVYGYPDHVKKLGDAMEISRQRLTEQTARRDAGATTTRSGMPIDRSIEALQSRFDTDARAYDRAVAEL